MDSFVTALDYWSRDGLSVNFQLAGTPIFLEHGEELPEAVYRSIKSSNRKLLIIDIVSALDWWRDPTGVEKGRAAYNVLELLVLVATKARLFELATQFLAVFRSLKFKKFRNDLRSMVVSQSVSMVGRWCLAHKAEEEEWSRETKVRIFDLLDCLSSDHINIDNQDALICLASAACLMLECISDYFKKISPLLPDIGRLKYDQEGYDRLRAILGPVGEKYGANLLGAIKSCKEFDFADATELFGINCNMNGAILYQSCFEMSTNTRNGNIRVDVLESRQAILN